MADRPHNQPFAYWRDGSNDLSICFCAGSGHLKRHFTCPSWALIIQLNAPGTRKAAQLPSPFVRLCMRKEST